jgi:flagellar motor switch/type III secretory pathway protein FliN
LVNFSLAALRGMPVARVSWLRAAVISLKAMAQKELPAETTSQPASVERWRRLWWLPCQLTVDVPLARFTVGELLRLQKGSIVSTDCSRSAEIPLSVDGQIVGWAEFDAVDEHIAARITELV